MGSLVSREVMKTTKFNFQGPGAESRMAEFSPIQVIDLELSRAIPDLHGQGRPDGQPYRRGRILLRLHGQPLGVIDVEIGKQGLPAEELANILWANLEHEIKYHLQTDGCPTPTRLDTKGLVSDGRPGCMQALDAFLQHAPFASVVIATHNRTDSLAQTITSLLEMDYPKFEIIVVDNAPATQETANFIRRMYGGDTGVVRYVREDYPGLSIAHNRGLQEVRAPFVAFTDDDVLVDRYWLANLIKGFNSTENVGCVTGMIFPYELETEAQAWIEQYGGFSKGFLPQVFDLKENRIAHPLYPYAAGWFGSGASMAFDTQILRSLAGFDPAIGAGTPAQGGDDLAAFFQVVSSGYRLVYEPGAILFHKHRREYLGLQRQAYGYGVGLTAFLMKTIVENPLRIISFAGRIPAGLAYLFGPRSNKNAKKQGDYPKELNRLEREGMLYGPIAYLRSRRQAQKAGLYLSPDQDMTEFSSAVKSEQTGD
jgi:O-antigen biosynthesis protein